MLPLRAILLVSLAMVVVSPAMAGVTEDKCKCLMCVCDVDPHPLPPAVPARHPPPSEPEPKPEPKPDPEPEPEPEPEPIPTPKYYPPPTEPEPKPVYYPPTTKPEPTPVYYYTPPAEAGYYLTPPAGQYGYPWSNTYETPGQMYPQYYPSSAHRSMSSQLLLLASFVLAAGVLSLLACRA
jgi:hypothetical protein